MTKHSLLIVASNFPPIQSAGVYRTLRMVKYLPGLGWKLQILTLSTDNLPSGIRTDNALLDQVDPNIPIYRAVASNPIETINTLTGRDKRRVKRKARVLLDAANRSNKQKPKQATDNTGWIQRLKDRITLPWMTPDRLVGWIRHATKRGIEAIKENNTEVVYSSGPEWSNHLVAKRLVTKQSLPWVADFRDPWVGNAFRSRRNNNSWEGRKNQSLELEVFELADVVIFNTERARQDAILRAGKFLTGKSNVIPNGYDPADFAKVLSGAQPKLNRHDAGPLRILHTGAFYGRRNIDSLLNVFGRMKKAGTLSKDDLHLDLIGRVRENEKDLIDRYSINDLCTITPPLPHGECLQQMMKAHVLLLVQTDAPLCIPGKLYEYIAVNKPVITLAGDGATADLVKKEGLGPCVAPGDLDQIESVLLQLIKQHRSKQLTPPDQTIHERFDGKRQMIQFNEALRQAITNKHRRSRTIQGANDE